MRVLGRKHKWRSEAAPKPAGKRPMRTDLSDACFAMLEACREQGPTAGLRTRWDALWRQWEPCVLGLDLRMAGLVLHTGWTVETAFANHRQAAEHMQAYFAHPLWASDDPIVVASNRCRFARSLLLAGDTSPAVRLLRQVFEEGTRATGRARVLCVRDALLVTLDALPPDAPCPPELAALASEVASRLRRRRAAAAMLAPGVANAHAAAGLRLTIAPTPNSKGE